MPNKSLNIFGYIGDPWSYSEDPAIVDTDIKAEVKDLANYDGLDVHINSYGGIATQGIAIYNIIRSAVAAMKKQKPDFTCTAYIEGIAASAASLIFCAGDKRVMRVGSQLMIHNALTVLYGNARDIRKEADVLDQYDLSIAAIYENTGKKSRDEYLKLMNDETYFIAEEAVESGLATEVDSSTESILTALPFTKGNYQAFMHRAAMARHIPQKISKAKENIQTKASNKGLANALFAIADEAID
ncbi:ClpP Protease subunit of ATP-dependent Clp proteases [uncultured Caudovirales phage]|uniref:ClpP Protease subunit of ATP-dependent Clp proteases n=1 Tax=uncultured Caudovirales phage TaxID=2100421 RepID=A0A6J5M9M3_9CAUD|nr:ClpP Protease subunit of ATP-dependent Clp proteases [uncultured Caudovirales phage]